MNFRKFLLTELRSGLGDDGKPYNPKHQLLKQKLISFHVNQNGEVVPMSGEKWGQYEPFIEIVPGYKTKYSLRAHNLQPTSKLFKDLMMWLKRYIPDVGNWNVELTNLSHPEIGKTGYYRTVDYYLGQTSTDFAINKIPKFLYHGTSTELWYEGIKQRGLLPRNINPFGSSGSYGTAVDSLSHDDKVYLAVHPDAATRSAAKQASIKHGGLPLILKIDTSGLFQNKFGADEDADTRLKYKQGLPQQLSQIMMGTISYQGKIPSSLIKPISITRRAPQGSNKVWQEDWEPFNEKKIERMEHPLTNKLKGSYYDDDADFFALYDAGIIGYNENGNKAVKREASDAEVRKILKESPWRTTAMAISRDISDWGRSGIKSLDYYPVKVDNKEHQKVIDALIRNKIYYGEGQLKLAWFDAKRNVERSIGLAKDLKMDYRKLMKVIEEIGKTYTPL